LQPFAGRSLPFNLKVNLPVIFLQTWVAYLLRNRRLTVTCDLFLLQRN